MFEIGADVALNRYSYTCPDRGVISAPGGTLEIITYTYRSRKPISYLFINCPCGKKHRVKMKDHDA
jgi:hypothetical protein